MTTDFYKENGQVDYDSIDHSSEKLANDFSAGIFKEKPVYDFFKRCFDIIIGLLGVTIGLPFMIAIALSIIISDFGSPFFVQERVGLNGKHFKCFKWRTMFKDAEARKKEFESQNQYNDVHFKIKDDPRIIPVGHFLRKYSIDETAQLLNLLNNTMSLIGPRPFVVNEQDQLPKERLLAKPGLTCYWQITDTEKMPIEEQLELDYKYIRERSVKTDVKIIFKTIDVVFHGKNS